MGRSMPHAAASEDNFVCGLAGEAAQPCCQGIYKHVGSLSAQIALTMQGIICQMTIWGLQSVYKIHNIVTNYRNFRVESPSPSGR
jgi:hypothetical protein